MKLGVIAQIRDEIDIIQPWLQHVDQLFDAVFLVDHQSVDGTSELLKQAVSQRPGWKYYYLDIKTYLQAATSSFMLHEAFNQDLDFLFFLDADEFIQVESRRVLESLLSNRPDQNSLADLHWKNCIRHEFDFDYFKWDDLVWVPDQVSNHKKIVIPREIYKKYGNELRISHGNHSASTKSVGLLSSTGIATLIHLPIRSRDQAIKKVIMMVIAMRGFSRKPSGRATQIYEILNRIADDKLTDDEVRGFTIAYDKILTGDSRVTETDLIEQHYSLFSFNEMHIACSQSLLFDPVQKESTFARQLANALNKPEQNIPEFVKLKLENEVIRIDPSDLNPTWPVRMVNQAASLLTKLKRKIHI